MAAARPKIFRQAHDFLIAVAEPVARPDLLHEYQLTPHSLYAAVSVGLQTSSIIHHLKRLSKMPLPDEVEKLVTSCTLHYGKVKLVLRQNRFFIESVHIDVLRKLLKDDVVKQARVYEGEGEGDLRASSSSASAGGAAAGTTSVAAEALRQKWVEGDDDEGGVNVFSFEVDAMQVEALKKRCIEVDCPAQEEYDFREDASTVALPADLKPTTVIRPYQEKSLSKMFGNGRARSGIIVLPCGAGKTLVGITAACTIKKSVLVFCTSGVAVEQWRHQFKLWSTVEDRHIFRFTSGTREQDAKGGIQPITITTYTMVSHTAKRSAVGERIMEQIRKRDWGLLLLDEVHVVPANMFRRVLTSAKAHCKLGLTATLVREDARIADLNFLIGPKLYEADWLDLQREGHIAAVQCAEVWCPMTAAFYQEYLNAAAGLRMLLYVMNPNKFRACEFLIHHHEGRGDKIIVFSDNVFSLLSYARMLGRPFIFGPTSQEERMRVLHQFRHNPAVNCVFISKVGDNAIDLPEANVIIQISSHYGSRRQEAQRLGRILRPKPRSESLYNAFFYSLVSMDTEEMYYSTKRRQFLITELVEQKTTDLSFATVSSQLDLLAQILEAGEAEGVEETVEDKDDIEASDKKKKATAVVKRSRSSLATLSGASGRVYSEFGIGARPAQPPPPKKAGGAS